MLIKRHINIGLYVVIVMIRLCFRFDLYVLTEFIGFIMIMCPSHIITNIVHQELMQFHHIDSILACVSISILHPFVIMIQASDSI